MCFLWEVTLRKDSSLFQDTTAQGLDCHNADVLWARCSPWVSKGASSIQQATAYLDLQQGTSASQTSLQNTEAKPHSILHV